MFDGVGLACFSNPVSDPVTKTKRSPSLDIQKQQDPKPKLNPLRNPDLRGPGSNSESPLRGPQGSSQRRAVNPVSFLTWLLYGSRGDRTILG